MPALRRDGPAFRLLVLIVATLAARAVTFGSPLIHVDEDFYLAVADAMTHGALPYVDWWDRKPVGLFLLYLPAAAIGLPGALWAYQAMAAAAVVATGWGIMRLADRAGWRAGALPAAVFYALWLDLADGQGGQSPVFYNALMVAAAWLVVGAAEGRRRLGLAAMLVVGLALQVKYAVVFEGIGFGLWLLGAEWRRRKWEALPFGVGLVTAALLPTGLALAAYVAIGAGDAFLFANFVSILHRSPDDAGLTRDRIVEAVAILSPILLTGPAWFARGGDLQGRVRAFLRWWLLIAVAAFVGFGGWYNHYTLPVMLPTAIMAAAFFAGGWRRVVLPLALLAVAGQVVLAAERRHRGTAVQFRTLADAVGRGPGALFLYSGPILLYAATGRPTPTRWPFPSHLEFRREAESIGTDQRGEIERIFRRRPAVVVMAPPIREEDPAIRALVLRRLKEGGYLAAPPVRVGSGLVIVWRAPATNRP